MKKISWVLFLLLLSLAPALAQEPEVTLTEPQATVEPWVVYNPTGWVATVGPGMWIPIKIPHWMPFRLVVSELWGRSGATGFIDGAENECYLSWVGLNGNGTPTWGSDYQNSHSANPRAILEIDGGGGPIFIRLSSTCSHIWPPREEQPDHYLIIDTTHSREGVRVSIIR